MNRRLFSHLESNRNHRARSTKIPPSQSYKRRRVACQHFPDDQTLRLQTGAGEEDVIHLPSGLDRADCERQEEEEEGERTQTGYRKFRSTEDQLAYLAQKIEDAFQEKKKVLAVFFDLSNAFDMVWKEGLHVKPPRTGARHKMYMWIQHFLFARTARAKLDGNLSKQVSLRK